MSESAEGELSPSISDSDPKDSAQTDAPSLDPQDADVTEGAPADSLDAVPADAGGAPFEAASAAELGERRRALALFVSVFVIATCGLVYELVAGALASYLLGDSIRQFSLVIGTYLSAMGLGSWLSQHVRGSALRMFIGVEILVGLVGGFSSTLLFLAFGVLPVFEPLLYIQLVVVGVLVGLEIPLLMQILRDRFEFKELVANVLFLDYAGALIASLLFPFVLVPILGLLQTSYLFGLCNALVAIWALQLFRGELQRAYLLRVAAVLSAGALALGLVFAGSVHELAESLRYEAKPIYSLRTPYQDIVITHDRGDLRLYLSGHLQFSSKDEHRYHEALVHPAMSVCPGARRVLVLGGGDGLALRELLKYQGIREIQLVDLDPAMTKLFRSDPFLTRLNGGSLSAPRVKVTNADGMRWLEETDRIFDLVVIDLPDPRNYSLGKLYSKSFYGLVLRHLSETGALVVQSTSPWYAPRSFWCVARTIEAAGGNTAPYHTYVPSFGEWGYVLATKRPRVKLPGPLAKVPLRFLDQATMEAMFRFPPDMKPPEVEVNLLNTQQVVKYYNSEWK